MNAISTTVFPDLLTAHVQEIMMLTSITTAIDKRFAHQLIGHGEKGLLRGS
jgi:hypothetical protein